MRLGRWPDESGPQPARGTPNRRMRAAAAGTRPAPHRADPSFSRADTTVFCVAKLEGRVAVQYRLVRR